MFTKILVCGFVVACVSALAALLERGGLVAEGSAQIPGCQAGHHCQAALVAPVSTERVLVGMLAN